MLEVPLREYFGHVFYRFRLRPRSLIQRMGDLPESRVTPSRAFCYAGVDYAGPLRFHEISQVKPISVFSCVHGD